MPHQTPPQLATRLQKTIFLAHEDHLFYAQDFRRRPLLFHAGLHQLRHGDAEIVIALVAVGEDDVSDYSAGVGHLPDGCATAELGVIGMRHDHERGL